MNKRKPRYRKKKRPNEDLGAMRLLILSTVILLAVLFKTVTGISTQTVFNEISSILTGEQSYADAISVLGQAAKEGLNKNAVLVFGKKLVSVPGEDTDDAAKEIENEGKPLDEEKKEPPMVNEMPKEVEEMSFKGRVISSPAFGNDEIDVDNLELMEFEEEYIDDTLDEEFEIPSPDRVDDNKYTLPFKYKKPLGGVMTSPFGYRVHPISGETTFHFGVDLAGDTKTPISAFAGGVVSERGYSTIFGNYVKIEHDDGFLSFYAHMSKINVKKGQKIKLGAKVGNVGSTGTATGPHLHFEVRKNGKIIDPTDYL